VTELPPVMQGSKGTAPYDGCKALLRAAFPGTTDRDLPVAGTYRPRTTQSLKKLQA